MPEPRSLRPSILFVLCVLSLAGTLPASDWPTWRFDAGRTGSAPDDLAETLHLQWVLELPEPVPAWHSEQTKLQYDALYEPIVKGKSLFIASMVRDSITCYSTESGKRRWDFHADGPVRFAPTAWRDRLFFVSDDGHLYCLDAATGKLLWRFRGGPAERWLLGNDRLINAWPARGAPVIYEDTVYFASSIWPFMGVFIHALDAETGRAVWTNSGTGSNYTVQQHKSPAFAGIAPQGYLAATEDSLYVPGGRSVPAVFDRASGALRNFEIGSRDMGSKGGGGFDVVASDDFFLNGGEMYRSEDGEFIDSVDAVILSGNGIIGKSGTTHIKAFELKWDEKREKDRRGREKISREVRTAWTAPLRRKIDSVFMRAGSRVYASGEKNEIFAVDLPSFDRGARVSWSTRLPDKPLNMIAADDRLVVSTDRGRIYCFGATKTDVKLPESDELRFVSRGATWKYLDDGSDQGTRWRAPRFDDSDWKSGAAPLGYDLANGKTTLSFGDDAKKKFVTSYFRCDFEAPASALSASGFVLALELRARVDDGAVIYLNGKEIGRLHMPEGKITAETLALRGTDEKSYEEIDTTGIELRPGTNTLAVEVHQVRSDSSDLAFDLELGGRHRSRVEAPTPRPSAWTARAKSIVELAGADAGYAFVLRVGSGALIDELLARTALHVVVIEHDARAIDAFRRRMSELGLYGTRTAAIPGAFPDVDLPPYLAELITSEDSLAPGLDEKVFRSLRPYSGAAVFPRDGKLSVVRRTTAPEGSGSWTHQYGDATNAVVSSDTAVKLPLGVLWFGGPSHKGVLPRHGHGPAPQIAGGRLIIEGRDMLRAVDIYTGRILWQRKLKGVGADYDFTSHEPGANAIGANYVSLEDAVYCVHDGECLALDPATGETFSRFRLSDKKRARDWGYLAVSGDALLTTSSWTEFDSPEFTAMDVASLRGRKLGLAVLAVTWLPKFKPIPYDVAIERFATNPLDVDSEFEDDDYASDDESDSSDSSSRRRSGDRKFEWFWKRPQEEHRAFLLANLNKLLLDDRMLEKLSVRDYFRHGADEFGNKYYNYLDEDPSHKPSDREALVLKRRILHKTYGLPDFTDKRPRGKAGSSAGKGSRRLACLDRHSGKIRWNHDATYELRHNAIAVGPDTVFAIDSMSSEEASWYIRRGKRPNEKAAIIALDLQTGRTKWRATEHVFGTWLGYSKDHDVLVQAGSRASDRPFDETRRGMVAYSGATGKILWMGKDKYSGPVMLLGRTVITQGYRTPGGAFDLLTGKRVTTRHPVSGIAVPWEYKRNYGCNTAIGCPNLLTFRSAAAGYFDLLGNSGTGNFGGFRSGCTSNLIPAGGILNAPDYTRTCSCSYQNQTSLALVHMPDIETWTFSALDLEGPVRRLGLNFGAPGDRRDGNGTLWIDSPSVGGDSPDPGVEILPAKGVKVTSSRYHSSAITESDLDWIASSRIEGDCEIVVPLRATSDLEIPSAVAGGKPLVVEGGRLSAVVTSPPAGDEIDLSLAHDGGSKGLDATIAGDESLATASVTVEFWVKADRDIDYIDTRVVKDKKGEQGYVFDNLKPRVRYYVRNTRGNNNSRVAELEAKEPIEKNVWTHLAFTYDASSGVGLLFVNGEEVARHEGKAPRPLWWDDKSPGVVVAGSLAGASRIDGLRICRRALEPARLLSRPGPNGRSAAIADPKDVVGHWRMKLDKREYRPGRYTVRLVFAELEKIEAGARSFDVRLQGHPVLTNFDVAREAGGTRRVVAKRFAGVRLTGFLRIAIAGRDGERPFLNGVEVRRED